MAVSAALCEGSAAHAVLRRCLRRKAAPLRRQRALDAMLRYLRRVEDPAVPRRPGYTKSMPSCVRRMVSVRRGAAR